MDTPLNESCSAAGIVLIPFAESKCRSQPTPSARDECDSLASKETATLARTPHAVKHNAERAMPSQVFAWHRFVAGSFGALLLCMPDELNRAMGIDRVLPAEEKFVLQNWGCFCLGVGGIAHAAQRFAPQAQRGVAKGMCLCFACAAGLALDALLLRPRGFPPAFEQGAAGVGAIFAVLLLAYSAALVLDAEREKST